MNNNFEEVSDNDFQGVSSDVFYKKRSKQASSSEWRNKLGLDRNPLMDGRHVEITDIQLVTDGY